MKPIYFILVITVILVGCGKKTSGNGGQKTHSPVPASSPNFPSASMPDEQYFAYLRTKYSQEDDPRLRTQYMKSYLDAYPKGKSMGEATALLEEAQKQYNASLEAGKISTVRMDCRVTIGNGQSIPVQGFIQLFRYRSSTDVFEEIKKEKDVASMFEKIESLESKNRSQRNEMEEIKLESSKWFYILYYGKAYNTFLPREDLVAQGKIHDGSITFSNVPANQVYLYYGSGMAGLNFVAYAGATKTKGGDTSLIDPSCLSFFCDPNSNKGSLDKTKLLIEVWSPIN